MGLSTEERYTKILFSISRIDDLVEDLKERSVAKLKSLVERLWYEFLKNESDGMLWITGCDLASNHLGCGLLNAAFGCHVPDQRDTLEDMESDLRKKDRFFDSYKTLSAFFDMERLLEGKKRAVLMTYVNTQGISYALCRYKDEFRDKYKDLNFLIRQIQGECFKIMKTDREYAYAWMLHHLCSQIYTMDEKDLVNQLWTKHCVPHDIKLRYEKYEEVFEAFKKVQFKKDLTLQERLDLTFLVMGEDYGKCEHKHKSFVAEANIYNKVKTNKVKINIKGIEEAYVKARAMHKEKEERHHSDISCEFTGNYVNHQGEICNRNS